MDNITKGYVGLQAAIIQQAVNDYKWAMKFLENPPKASTAKARYKYNEAERTKAECEKFFLSEWGQMLTGGYGAIIIGRCKREVAQEKESDLNGRS